MKTESMPLVSVFTSVYNRADKIHRVFRSLMGQTYRKIEHIIIDDGSTDNIDEVCRAYMEQVDYPVIYRKKENGGMHTAINMAWDLATGEYVIQLDSDDELLPQAIEHLVQLWNAIPEDVRDQYWCVQGRCRTQHSEAMVGLPNPEGINELPLKEARAAVRKCGGEREGLMKRAILKDYRFPEPKSVTNVAESVIWFPLNQKYKTWYTNEIVRVYYVNEGDCLSKPKRNSQNMSNVCWNSRWCLLNRKNYGGGIINLLKYLATYQFSTDAYKEQFPYRCVTFRQDWLIATALCISKWPLKLTKPVMAKILHVV